MPLTLCGYLYDFSTSGNITPAMRLAYAHPLHNYIILRLLTLSSKVDIQRASRKRSKRISETSGIRLRHGFVVPYASQKPQNLSISALRDTHHILKGKQKTNVKSNMLLFDQTIEYEHSDSKPLYDQQQPKQTSKTGWHNHQIKYYLYDGSNACEATYAHCFQRSMQWKYYPELHSANC